MSEGKIIKRGSETQEKIIKGVVEAAETIKTTMGPSGKHCAIVTSMGVEISRDGSTVAKSICFKDPEKNIGATLVKNASSNTEEEAGDGTSTSAVLIEEMVLKGQKAIRTGSNINEIKSGMLKAQKWMTDYISKNSISIDGDLEKIRKVATISANNDPEVGDLVVSCMEKVGVDGVITADMASGLDTTIDVTTGMKLNRGWASPQYITSPGDGKCIMENAYVLIVGQKLSNVNQLIPILEPIAQSGRPFLIICDDIDEVVNSTLVLNTLQGAIRCCVVKGIDFGDNRKNIMQDIAISVGGVYINPETGTDIMNATIEDLGVAKKIVVSRDSCIIYEGAGDKNDIRNRVDVLKHLLESVTSSYDKDKISKRIANLSGGIGIIKAGGASEVEKLNRKATIEDSILASKSAISEGCSLGGGYTYLKGSIAVEKDKSFWKSLIGDEKEGAEIVFSSLPIILKTIAENSGLSGDIALEKVKNSKSGIGYNAKTKEYSNLLNDGILDSSKVLRVALENSISAASMILLIECTVVEDSDSEKDDLK